MGKILNDKVKSKTEEILSVKTHQDFNKQGPNLKDPNQAENIPTSQEVKKAGQAVKASIDSELNISKVDDNKHSKLVLKELPNTDFIKPKAVFMEHDDSQNLTLMKHKNNSNENKKKEN
jgi:hypothetical protein